MHLADGYESRGMQVRLPYSVRNAHMPRETDS